MKRRKNRLIDIRTRLAVTVLNIASRSDFKPDFRSLSSTKKTKSPIRLCQIIHLQANRYALSIFSFGKLVKKQLRHTTSFMSIRRQFWHFNIGSKNANGKKYDSAYVSQSRNPNTNFDFENDVKWTFSNGSLMVFPDSLMIMRTPLDFVHDTAGCLLMSQFKQNSWRKLDE